MKAKTTDKVIADLKELFEVNKDKNFFKDSLEIKGEFFIYKRHIKRKKAKKMLSDYLSKVTITDGFLVKKKKSFVYSLIFKIVKDDNVGKSEKKEKEEKGQKQKGKGKKGKDRT